MNTIKQKKNSV